MAGLSFEPLQVSQSSVGFPKTLADWEDWPMEHRTGGFRLERKRVSRAVTVTQAHAGWWAEVLGIR